MFGKPKLLMLILLPLMGLTTACERIYEDLAPCEIYLEFRFDYNLDFADQFDPLVGSVNVFIFDSNEKLLLIRESASEDLIGGNRMALTGLPGYGKYKALTIGCLSEYFRVADYTGVDLVPGQTTLAELVFELKRQSNTADVEFPHLYFGEVIEVDYTRALTAHAVLPVDLIRDTNKFRIVLENLDGETPRAPVASPYYTFEMTTPEGAKYDRNNEPVEAGTRLTYLPYALTLGQTSQFPAVGYLNTCRLFDRSGFDYELIVRETLSGQQVWSYNLMTMLKATQPDYPIMSFGEYLDRRGEWDMIVYYRGGEGSQNAFMAFAIRVNGWIVWLNEIGV